jgi:hypothetical protein
MVPPGSKVISSVVVRLVTGVGAAMPSVTRILVPVIWISSSSESSTSCARAAGLMYITEEIANAKVVILNVGI